MLKFKRRGANAVCKVSYVVYDCEYNIDWFADFLKTDWGKTSVRKKNIPFEREL